MPAAQAAPAQQDSVLTLLRSSISAFSSVFMAYLHTRHTVRGQHKAVAASACGPLRCCSSVGAQHHTSAAHLTAAT